jgi:hypothetical protein
MHDVAGDVAYVSNLTRDMHHHLTGKDHGTLSAAIAAAAPLDGGANAGWAQALGALATSLPAERHLAARAWIGRIADPVTRAQSWAALARSCGEAHIRVEQEYVALALDALAEVPRFTTATADGKQYEDHVPEVALASPWVQATWQVAAVAGVMGRREAQQMAASTRYPPLEGAWLAALFLGTAAHSLRSIRPGDIGFRHLPPYRAGCELAAG